MRARSNQPDAKLSLTLTTKDAVAYAAPLALSTEVREIRLPLSAFRPAALLLMPRPYPGFLPLQYQPPGAGRLKITEAEVLHLTWEVAPAAGSPVSVDIESISLQ